MSYLGHLPGVLIFLRFFLTFGWVRCILLLLMGLRKFFGRYWDRVILGVFVLVYIGTLATLSVLRHDSFASNFDLSNMDHTLWNTLYGEFFRCGFMMNMCPGFRFTRILF